MSLRILLGFARTINMLGCGLSAKLVCSLVVLLSAPVEEKPGEGKLKEAGLKRSSAYYMLAAETTLNQKINALQALRKEIGAIQTRIAQIDANRKEAKETLLVLTQQRLELEQQLPNAGSVQQHNLIVTNLNQLTDRMRLLDAASEKDDGNDNKDDPAAILARKRDIFLQKILDLRNEFDAVGKRYDEIRANKEVAEAIEQINKSGKTKFTLGPTRAFLANRKTLERYEKSIQTESIPLRNQNNVFWVDTVLNGKLAKPMIFDTGAGIVLLPAGFADELGIKISESDPVINLQVADGRTIKARQTKLKSIRVGKFTVVDVECAVLPADVKNAQPLLGGSFLKHFAYKLSPDQAKLSLTSLDPPAPEAIKPKSASKAGTVKRKSAK